MSHAADGTWNVLTNNASWALDTNWQGNAIANGTNAVANFNTLNLTANRNVNLNGLFSVGKLIFGDTTGSNNWTLSNGAGGTLTLITDTGIAPVIEVVNEATTMAATLAGTQGFTKTGAGTLTLTSAAITLTGGISLSEGTLNFAAGSLGTNVLTVGSATLVWAAGNTQDLTATDQLRIADGVTAVLNTGGATQTVTLSKGLLTGPLANGAVTKTGAGTLVLTGANTWTGLTKINVGRLVLAGGNNRLLSSGAVALGQGANLGILQLGDATGAVNQTLTSLTTTSNAATAPTNAVVGGAAAVSTLTLNITPAATTITYGGLLGGPGTNENNLALTKSGAGTLILTNAANTFTGGVNIQAGTLEFAAGALAANAITFTGNSSLVWNGTNTQDISSQVRLNNGVTATINSNGNTVTLATAFQVGTNNAVTKGGAGNFIITAVNTWTNGTRINQGRIILSGGDNRLSELGALSFGNGGNSGVLQLGDASGISNQTATNLTVNGTGTANAIVGGNAAISTLTINTNTVVAYGGLLGGTGTNENQLALAKSGSGTLALGGTNTFAGDVTINGGILLVTKSTALGTGTKVVHIHAATNTPSLQLDGTSADIVLASAIRYVTSNDDATAPAILSRAGNNVISGGISPTTGGVGTGGTRIRVDSGTLTLEGDISPETNAAASSTVIFDGAGSGSVSGIISSNGAHVLGVRKTGAGTWTLLAENTYTGTTEVLGGRLNISTTQTGGGEVSVGDGATLGLKLGATGETLAASTLTLGSFNGGTLRLDLGGFANPTPALITTGAFLVNGTNVIHVAGTGLSVGQFALIDYTGVIGGSGIGGLWLGQLPARVTANLLDDTVNTRVLLNITAFDVPKWTGALSNQWDINDGTGTGTLNWREVNSGLETRYLQGGGGTDSVLFDDTAGVPLDVNLTATLTPATVTVTTSTNAFVFGGAGKLSGSTSVIKNGSAKLTFAELGLNDYTGATTINGGTLQIGDGSTLAAGRLGSGDVFINNSATLSFNRPDVLLVANLISGSATSSILQQGTGDTTLSGNNSSFDGAITVSGGTLTVGNANALGSAAGLTTVNAGALLELGGFSVSENFKLNGGTLRNATGATATVSGTVTLDGGGTLSAEGAAVRLTISTAIEGTGGLTKAGTGTLVLTADGFYTGGTIISNGVLQVGATGGAGTTGALPTGDIALAPVNAGDTATLTILRAGAVTFANNITSGGAGTNAIIIGVNGAASPSGTVTFSGNNSFTGNVTVNGGALRITNSSALGTGTKVVRVASNALPTLLLDGTAGNITLASSISYQLSSDGGAFGGSIVNLVGNNVILGVISMINGGGGNARINVQAGSLTLAGGVDASGATGNRNLLLGGAGTGLVSGLITDTGSNVVSVVKDGESTWALTHENTFTGVVTVSEGTLQFNSAAATGLAQALGLGTGVVTIGTATTVGTLEYTGLVDGVLGRGVTVGGVAGGVVKNSGPAKLTLAGTVTKNGRPLTLAAGVIEVTGQITGATLSDLIVDGATVTLTNATNNYNGTTHVRGNGTLKNGASEVLTNTTVLQLGEAAGNTGGTYDLNGFNETIAGLTGAGSGEKVVTNRGATDSTLTVTGTSTFDGVIQDGPTAKLALVKNTGGIFTLTGGSTYTGATLVSAGALQVGSGGAGTTQSDAISHGASGSGITTVTGSGVLSGSGLVRGDLTLSGGSIRAGDTSTAAGDRLGTLWIGGNMAFESGTIVFQITASDLNIAALSDVALEGYGEALLALPVSEETALAAAIGTTAYDHLEILGSFNWAATGTRTVTVELAGSTDIHAGDIFNLLDWALALNPETFNAGGILRAGGETGTHLALPTLADGLGWDTTHFARHGLLVVTQVGSVPEPSMALLLCLSCGAIILRRRRSRPGTHLVEASGPA